MPNRYRAVIMALLLCSAAVAEEPPSQAPAEVSAPASSPAAPPTPGGAGDTGLPPSVDLSPKEEPAVRWGSYALHLIHYFGSGNLTTGHVAWTPLFRAGSLRLRGELGLALPKNALGDLFLAFNYELFARLPLGEHFTGELGGGLQTFASGNGGTAPLLSAGLAWSPWRNFVVDRIVVSASRFFRAGAPLNHVKLGFALTFP